MQTGRMFGLEFLPEYTPTGLPVLTCFRIEDRPYVVDIYGNLYRLQVEGDDPDRWMWIEMQRL